MNVKLIDSLLIDNDIFNFKPDYNTKNTEFIDLFYIATIEIGSEI